MAIGVPEEEHSVSEYLDVAHIVDWCLWAWNGSQIKQGGTQLRVLMSRGRGLWGRTGG